MYLWAEDSVIKQKSVVRNFELSKSVEVMQTFTDYSLFANFKLHDMLGIHAYESTLYFILVSKQRFITMYCMILPNESQ